MSCAFIAVLIVMAVTGWWGWSARAGASGSVTTARVYQVHAGLIALVSGESTGKSTLTTALGTRMPALVVADRNGMSWVVSDSDTLVLWRQDDFPWQPDPQRDAAHAWAMSQQILGSVFAENPSLPILAVAGSLDERIAAVVNAVGR